MNIKNPIGPRYVDLVLCVPGEYRDTKSTDEAFMIWFGFHWWNAFGLRKPTTKIASWKSSIAEARGFQKLLSDS
jgi:hypothetical protein